MRGKWLNDLYASPTSGNGAAADAQELFRKMEWVARSIDELVDINCTSFCSNILSDAMLCASNLIQQRKAGEVVSLPVSEWITASSLPAPLQTSAPSSSPLSRSSNLPSSDTMHISTGTSALQLDAIPTNRRPGSLTVPPVDFAPDGESSDDEFWSGAEPTEEELQHIQALETQPTLAPFLFDSPPNSQAGSVLTHNPSSSSHTMSSREPTTLPTQTQSLPEPSSPMLGGSTLHSKLLPTLNRVFHLQSFRPNQAEIMSTFLDCHDVFVLMPTGGGKSLCFQLPAFINRQDRDMVTFVISPLKALMKDQMRASQALGLDAVMLSSDLQESERRETWDAIMANNRSRACLAYITPEMLEMSDQMRNNMTRLWRANKIAGFVIDEAHCIQNWKTFRSSVSRTFYAICGVLILILCLSFPVPFARLFAARLPNGPHHGTDSDRKQEGASRHHGQIGHRGLQDVLQLVQPSKSVV